MLSQALSLYDASTNAWERALKCLPEDASECTSVELRLKEQCRTALKAVTREKEQAVRDGEAGKNVASVPMSVVDNGDMPWQRALSMVNEMQNSSVRAPVFCCSNPKSLFDLGLGHTERVSRTYSGCMSIPWVAGS